jgi:hypothetical protein
VSRAAFGLLALATLAISPRVADAGCPGGGGPGGPGGAAGGGGGASDGEPACTDTSDVVGYRHCTPYAAWAVNPHRPPFFVEGGVIVRRFDSLLDGQTGSVTHGAETFTYRVASAGSSMPAHRSNLDTAVLSTVRVGAGLPYGIFTAIEIDLGGVTHAGAVDTEMMNTGALGTPELSQHGGLIADSLAIVGVRVGNHIGRIGVEMAGGLRTVDYGFASRYVACEQGTSVAAFGALAEARVRGELWLGPWLTAGAEVGASVLEQHEWMGALFIGVHTRAYAAPSL